MSENSSSISGSETKDYLWEATNPYVYGEINEHLIHLV